MLQRRRGVDGLQRVGREFAERLLHSRHVLVTPGELYGPGGAGHLRLCFATDPPEIELALERLRNCATGLVTADAR